MSDPADSLLEDKRQSYHRFTRLTFGVVVTVIIILALMAATIA